MSATEHANGEVIESTAVDVTHPPAVIPPVPPRLDVVPTVVAGDLVKRLEVIRQAQSSAMVPNVDYGVIPGTDKPTLLKPGAEKLGVLFQLDVQLVNEKVFGPGDHLTVISHATVFHAPTGARLGYGEGVCTTREKKYGKRTAKRKCPQCGAEQINRSKWPPRENPNAEPGWYCHAKFGGCGAGFPADDQRVTGQTAGEVENPDLPDLWNTVVKMAAKRARVDAVLAVTGASALFTQDVEDHAPPQEPPATSAPAAPRLNETQRNRVLSAIADADQNEKLLFAAVGISSAEELTAGHTQQIRALLDITLETA